MSRNETCREKKKAFRNFCQIHLPKRMPDPLVKSCLDLWLKFPLALPLTARWAKSLGSGETARMRRLVGTFAVRICYNGTFPAIWLNVGHRQAISYLPLIFGHITKTYLYNFDHLKPDFYIVKLGFTGVYIIFLIFAQKHRLWVLVRTASATKKT